MRSPLGETLTTQLVEALVTVTFTCVVVLAAIVGIVMEAVVFMISLSELPFVPSLNVPPTSSLDPGELTPIHTFPEDSYILAPVRDVPLESALITWFARKLYPVTPAVHSQFDPILLAPLIHIRHS